MFSTAHSIQRTEWTPRQPIEQEVLDLGLSYNNVEYIEFALKKGAKVSFKRKNWLYHYTHDIKMTELLLKYYNNDINDTKEQGETVLHVAVKNNRTQVIQLLLAKGADPNVKDTNGRRPIETTSDYKIIKNLLEHGSKITKYKTNPGISNETWDRLFLEYIQMLLPLLQFKRLGPEVLSYLLLHMRTTLRVSLSDIKILKLL